MPDFRRRTYRGLRHLWHDLRRLVRQRRAVARLLAGDTLSPALRERLMLVVTAVNDCRYCARLHTRLAERAGVTRKEAAQLLVGSVEHGPEEEIPALLYAQRWAESDAEPDSAARTELIARYGRERAALIEAALQLIRMGNLIGNTWDLLLFRLSGGRLGDGRAASGTR